MIRLNIRQVKIEDIEEIAAIEKVCFPPSEAAGKEVFYKRYAAFGECFFAALTGDKIVGFINGGMISESFLKDIYYHDETLHDVRAAYQAVFGLAVLPGFQHMGIASQLLETFIKTVRRRGKTGMVLTCKENLIPFYQKHGFVNMGKSESIHGNANWHDMYLKLS